MKKLVPCILVAASLSQCRSDYSSGSYYSEERQQLDAAKTAEEWAERVKVDLGQSDYWSNETSDIYAELPPQDKWDQAFALIEGEGKNSNGKQILQILSSLMKGEQATAETLLQKRVLAAEVHEYYRPEVLSALYAVSTNKENTATWINSNKPDLLLPKKESNYSSSTKKDWEIELAKNNVDKALELLWKTASLESISTSDRQESLSNIIEITDLLGSSDETRKALDSFITLYTKSAKNDTSSNDIPYVIANYLANNQQWAELEGLLEIEHKAELSESDKVEKSRQLLICSYFTQSPTVFLTSIEKLNGTLSQKDFFETLDEKMGTAASLGELYVKALNQSQRNDEAWAIASRLTIFNRSSDEYYQLALATNPQAFPTLLEQISVYDPYEERPLIWKAKLALLDQQVEKSMELITQAIALDPSDGDQGKRTRMHAYAVLADVHAARGEQEKETFFREVVAAIRDGEEADNYLYAGLTEEAIKRYKSSLGRFNDAYCLQSRLALTLAKNGRFDEAIPHFEKAFNLMPVSFGPRESHCFGCEGLYSDERVHPIAERILNAFVKNNPDNPRAPYLLGMVLDEMKQTEAANKAYIKALELDPKYYNAAKKLLSNYKATPEKSEEKTALIRQILTFVPYANTQDIYQSRADLKQAWIDAGSVAKSPFTLTPLSWDFPQSNKQYVKTDHYSYFGSEEDLMAIDGWSRDELLRNNSFLSTISSYLNFD